MSLIRLLTWSLSIEWGRLVVLLKTSWLVLAAGELDGVVVA